ncbi:interferon-inducible GTPase 5-like [Xenia sp. Carnegie-2017]|uniref:interferon-inducible GTPase 5-like n=1 Tax=Xenia sp. Carnegie-2017 TaxID=2897299 RepID=UPI001F034168|nr:interferon-inducible GTPase 5-like [Xenia sp. Carnegie-2017]
MSLAKDQCHWKKVKKDGLDGISDWYICQIKEWEKNEKVFAFIGSKKSGNFLIEALTPRNSNKDPEIKFKNLRLNSTLKKPKFRKLDAFLLIVKSRLKNERAIAKKILEKHRKPVIFIIAHTDEGKDKDRKESVKDLVKDESDIYVIDKEDKSKYDFNRLLGDIESKLLKRRKDLFLQCLNQAVFLNTRKNKERFKQAQKHSVDTILEFYSKNLISLWIDTEINFAVTGNSGTGKSSFINAVRGIKASEKKAAAPVGIIEMRKKPTEYSHPNHKNIIFWDLPGIGTPTYPNLKEYCTKVGGLEKYDAFLIFCKSRFTQHDKELAENVSKELDKPFFFIRTNVDTELKNAKDDEGPKFDEASVMKRMRKNCLKNLEGLIHHEKDVFLIDNKVTEKYDFQRLKESIAKSLPEEKQESFVASLDKSTHAIIRIKANFLRAQVQLVIVLFVIAESNPEVLWN